MNKFVDVRQTLKHHATFNLIFGGRGIGKTYSALDICRNLKDEFQAIYGQDIGDDGKFILLRRTWNEIEMLADTHGNPFKTLNRDKGDNIQPKKLGRTLCGYYRDKELLGYGVALSTMASIRGYDFSDVKLIIFDEFIPEKHVQRIKAEGRAFLNAYETINRNRELFGELPVINLIMTNSNDINSDLLVETGLLRKCENMVNRGQAFSYLPDFDATISFLKNKAFYNEKRETALYKFSQNSDFSRMALDNEFVDNDFSNIVSKSLKGYENLFGIGDRMICRSLHSNDYYVTGKHGKKCALDYEDNDMGRRRILQDFGGYLSNMYIAGRIYFENYELKKWFVTLFMGKRHSV